MPLPLLAIFFQTTTLGKTKFWVMPHFGGRALRWSQCLLTRLGDWRKIYSVGTHDLKVTILCPADRKDIHQMFHHADQITWVSYLHWISISFAWWFQAMHDSFYCRSPKWCWNTRAKVTVEKNSPHMAATKQSYRPKGAMEGHMPQRHTPYFF